MLTTTLLWSPPISDATPAWTIAVVHNDWLKNVNGVMTQTYWTNGDEAVFPAAGTSSASPEAVAISDTAGNLVYATTIQFSNQTLSTILAGGSATSPSYYNIQTTGTGTTDELQIPTAQQAGSTVGTTIDAQAGTVASISVATVSAGTTGDVQVTGTGSLTIAAGAVANVNNLTVGPTSYDTATLDIEGTLNVAANDTLNVAYQSVLTGGSSGVINLAAGSTLDYSTTASSTFNGVINGAGSVNVDAGSGTLVLGGANGYQGGINIASTVQLAGPGAQLGASGTSVTLSGAAATLDLNGDLATIGGLQGTGTIENTNAAGSFLTVNIAGSADDVFSGNIANIGQYGITAENLGLIKAGTGTLELGGTDLYTGATSIAGGKLMLDSNGALPSGTNLDLTTSGMLDLNGNNVTVASARSRLRAPRPLIPRRAAGPQSISKTMVTLKTTETWWATARRPSTSMQRARS
jgi:fibronectin-binding autotransporter adhesin